MKKIISIIDKMKSDKVSNYVIAGLDSYLLQNGAVRLFENSRSHQDQITPHSHRFDFTCLVLQGQVVNIIWTECNESEGDFFQSSKLTYDGEIGKHSKQADGRAWYKCLPAKYGSGEIYSMKADEIHSIQFSRNAKVILFEGPTISDSSIIIEPVVNNLVIPTYENKDYMFLKGDAA